MSILRSPRFVIALIVAMAVAWVVILVHGARDLPGEMITLEMPGDADLTEADAVRLGAMVLGRVTGRPSSEFRPVPYREGAPGVFALRPNATSSGYVLWSDEKASAKKDWSYMTAIERMPGMVQVTVQKGE